MSKFKSFASQGSFRDYQLENPDESSKILQQKVEVVRGKEKAEQFRQGSASLYLQAQKLVQGLEEQNRKINFDLETENRQQFKDQLTEEYNIQTQAAAQRAKVQQKTFQDLSQFSQTAFKLAGEINNKITENQTKANIDRAYRAGADYKTVVAIQGLSDGLTKAELAQQDFIRDRLAQGGNIDAYFALYESRNTRGFINNLAVAQNTARGYAGAHSKYIEEYALQNPDATADQLEVASRTFTSEFIANNLKTADGKSLNPELLNSHVYPIIRQAETRILGGYDQLRSKERVEKVSNDGIQVLNTIWDSGGGVEYIHAYHTLNPSEQKRKILAKWTIGRLQAGTLTPEEANAILDNKYEGPNGKLISWREQFPASAEVGAINEAIRKTRTAANNEYRAIEIARENATEDKIKQYIDKSVIDGDGVFSPEERAVAEELQKEGPIGFKSKALEFAVSNWTVSGRQALELDARFQKKADAGTLTVADLTDAQGNYNVYKKFLPIAEGQDKWRQGSQFKPNMDAIDRMVANDPAGKIKAAPISGASNWTVKVKQGEMRQEYLKQLTLFNGDHNKAFAVVAGMVEAEQSVQGAINNDGHYASVVKDTKDTLAGAKIKLAEREKLVEQIAAAEFGKDATRDANLFGPVVVYNSYDDMKLGKAPSPEIELGAQIRGVSKLEFMNYLAQGAGLPPITVSEQVQNLVENIIPTTRRLYNTYRTNERTERANYTNNNSLSTAPTRGAFNVVQYVSNDPRFKDRAFGPIVYDEHGHGGKNMHVHYEFATQEEALAAKALYESKGFRISSFMRPEDTDSAHSKGFAIDVAPPLNLPYNEQSELNWIRSVNAVIGYDPTQVNSNE